MRLAERLWVGADFDPRKEGGVIGVTQKVRELAEALRGTGVTIKINSILRACGFDLIAQINSLGLGVCPDLKLNDISNTLELDAVMLAMYKPKCVTVMASSSSLAIQRVKTALGASTQVIGVTVLTDISDKECRELYCVPPLDMVIRFARHVQKAGADGIVSSALEAPHLRALSEFAGLTLTTPGIRPEWAPVDNDDQRRVTTITEAIRSGADRIVLGRPIIRATNPRDAVMRTLEEIETALAGPMNVNVKEAGLR